MKKMKKYYVVDGKGEVLFSGRKRDVERFYYPLWCYDRRFDLQIVWRGEYL